jgi:hypothetical protein
MDDIIKQTSKLLNMINKKKRRSMNATPTRTSSKSQWQGAQEDTKQKQDGKRQSMGRIIT